MITPEEERQLEELLPTLPPISSFAEKAAEMSGETVEQVMAKIRRCSFTVYPASHYHNKKKEGE